MKMKEAEKGSKAGDIRQRGWREVKCWEKRAGRRVGLGVLGGERLGEGNQSLSLAAVLSCQLVN